MLRNKKSSEFLLSLSLLTLALGWFLYLAFSATGYAGGEDGVMHFLYAKYAADYPENFLNLWAKPVFTLVAFPFAQMGFVGVVLLNVLLGIGTAYFLFLIAKKLKLSSAWVVPIWLIFTPQYYFVMPSALTEVLFSFLLTAAIWLVLSNRLLAACLLVSFLPLVRSEGYLFILLFALWLLYQSHWKILPILASGLLVYSVIGGVYFNDFLWLIHQHPYGDASAIYGRGTWHHYLSSYRHIWGMPISFVLVLALLLLPMFWVKQWFADNKNEELSIWVILIFGGFMGYLVAHSYVWAVGKSGSLGLIRVMVATMPLAVLISFCLWDLLLQKIHKKWMRSSLQLLFLLVVIRTAPEMYPAPFNFEREKPFLETVGAWYKQSEYAGKQRVYLFAPSAYLALGINPFNTNESMGLYPGLATEKLEEGEIILWDSHFAPNEAGLPFEALNKRKDLKIIASFKPNPPFTTLNNYPYEVVFFQKISP